MTAMAIPTAVSIFLEVPKNGQFPRNWASRMLLTKIQLIIKDNIVAHGILLFLAHHVHEAQHDSETNKGAGGLNHEFEGLKTGKIIGDIKHRIHPQSVRVPAPKISRTAA